MVSRDYDAGPFEGWWEPLTQCKRVPGSPSGGWRHTFRWGNSAMHHLGHRSADAAVMRQVSSVAERLLLVAGLVSALIVVLAALGS